MSRTNPDKVVIYLMQERCWDLSTGKRIEEYEHEHAEADTAMLYIYSQLRKREKRMLW